MSNSFEIRIEPFKFYNKYAWQDYIPCGIDFCFPDDENHCFGFECDNKSLLEIVSSIDDYFNGKIEQDTEFYYDIPWIVGDFCKYPFSFKVDVAKKQWEFRYEKSPNSSEFDFIYQMSEDEVRSMRSQIEKEYAKTDWQALGKSELYTFNLPPKEFEWCYSAKAFNEALNELCKGRKIEAIYVSATNYAEPLRVSENYVNYYVGSEIFIQLEGVLLNLLIFAGGLFKWRSFGNSEITVVGPHLDYIQDGDEEFCKIDDVYQAFKLEYRNARIENVTVNDTDCWPWDANGFDESQLGDPIELPEEIFFNLENGNTLSFVGLDDDFGISIKGQTIESCNMSEYQYMNEYEREEMQKYEGIYTPEEIELNKKLYKECLKEDIDFALIEELLKQGADPLGPTDGHGWGLLEHIYGELVGPNGYLDGKYVPHIPKITELFLKYGMDVSSPRIPYDNDNSLHPLYCFLENESGIKALKMLLDAGLDAESAAEFWETAIFDQINVCNFDPNDEEWHDRFVWMMKMIMLVASYDHVLNDDEGLYKTVGCAYNSYDIHNFRNWEDYYYIFDTSRCKRHPELCGSVVRIYDVKTNNEVWKIGFYLPEGSF